VLAGDETGDSDFILFGQAQHRTRKSADTLIVENPIGFIPDELTNFVKGPTTEMSVSVIAQQIQALLPCKLTWFWDESLKRVLCFHEGPIRRTKEGESEWEPIKILLEGDGNSNKTNTTFNTRLRLTTHVDQAHVATRVPLDLGTNTQPSNSRTQWNTKPRVH
jgi:hypothetical protein